MYHLVSHIMPPPKSYTGKLSALLAQSGSSLIGEYQDLRMNSKITFQCSCGSSEIKTLTSMFQGNNALCRSCARKVGEDHKRMTFIEKYGVPHPQQSEEVRNKTAQTNLQKYGAINPAQNKGVKEKIKQTNIAKYGTENPFKSEVIQSQIRATNIERYSVANAMQSPAIQAKLEKTSMERYGTRRPSENSTIKAKIKTAHTSKSLDEVNAIKASLQRYGTTSPNHADIVKQHKMEASLQKYGTPNPMQNQEIQAKAQRNAFRHKDFTMPSGAIRRVQGYEPFALKELLNTYTEDQIITDRAAVPRIPYTVGGKQRYYFPDIYLPHIKKIIEVKSTWTYSCTTDNISQKEAATRDIGYDYELWVYNGKGERCQSILPSST